MLKECTKCWEQKNIHNFRKDASKRDGLYPSCIDCYRKRTWNIPRDEKYLPRIEKVCALCWTKFKPRNTQVSTNIKWKFYCSRVCYNKVDHSNSISYYDWYRPYILERDWHKCFVCMSNERLHVHHIKTRWSGWSNDYQNLITLCAMCHTSKAHWPNLLYYKELFLSYTMKFTPPNFRSEIMEKSIRDHNLVKQFYAKLARDKYYANKELHKERWKEANKKRDAAYLNAHWLTYSKFMQKKANDRFQEKYGMSARKYKYRKSKWLI